MTNLQKPTALNSTSPLGFWDSALGTLSRELSPQQFKTWIQPLTLVSFEESDHSLTVGSPLRSSGCDLITITQYLRPTNRHHPVERWVKPEEFVELAAEAKEIGFLGVMSGPLVRSSYRAGRLYKEAMAAKSGVTRG